jgi:hypothetical protein
MTCNGARVSDEIADLIVIANAVLRMATDAPYNQCPRHQRWQDRRDGRAGRPQRPARRLARIDHAHNR